MNINFAVQRGESNIHYNCKHFYKKHIWPVKRELDRGSDWEREGEDRGRREGQARKGEGGGDRGEGRVCKEVGVRG